MASEQEEPPPPKKQTPPVAHTTISSLGDDLLLEIFLRLPSLPSLVRAAFTCRAALHAVRSSRVFRRRFRELHPPPLLGLFLDIYHPETPPFAPVRRRSDPDHAGDAAAVSGADFHLTRLPDDDDPYWSMRDCRDGYVVLVNWNTDQMAVYNPLTLAMHLFPIPPEEICEDMHVEYHVLSSEEDPKSFHVVCVCHEKWGAQAAVISSDTREWQIFPFTEAASLQDGNAGYSPHDGTLVNGHIYWTKASRANASVLNTTTLQFSLIDLPPHIEGQGVLTPGETKDGELCIVCAVQHTLIVWLRRADDDGVERWMLDNTFPLSQLIAVLACHPVDHDVLKILAIVDGFVYLCTYYEDDPKSPGFFLSFCLETEKLDKLCPILHFDDLYPYMMAWPPSLVLNKPISST